jgi:hypothetical protein
MVFQATVVMNPAVAAAPQSSLNMGAATAGQSLKPNFNPLLNPQVTMLVQFPRMTAAGYGGVTRAIADVSAILAEKAGLGGPTWVTAAAVNNTPLTINATVSVGPSEHTVTLATLDECLHP